MGRPMGAAVAETAMEAEARALFARATGLSREDRRRINKRIRRYKTAGVWAILDALYGFKAAGASALNWVADRYNLTASGSIAHTPNRGWQNAGGHLKTGFIPSSAPSPNYTRDSAAFGVRVRSPVASGVTRIHMGVGDNGFCSVETNTSNALIAKVNTNGGNGLTWASMGTTGGLILAVRRLATTTTLLLNSTSATGSGLASAAVPIREFYIGASNSFGTPAHATTDLYQGALIGAALTDKQGIDVDNADLEYVTDIVAWGDSLTAGAGASAAATTAYPPVSGNLFSPVRDISNQGIGAQTSTQIAARMGAQPITVTVTGNAIPASGGVAVTAKSINPLYNSGTYMGTMTGTLAGVHGTMSTDGSGNWTFTRTTAAGGSTACPAGTVFVPDLADVFGETTAWLWLGRNGADAGYTIAGDIAACVAKQPRSLVAGVTMSTGDSAGAIAGLAAVNAALAATYGDRYVDLMAALVAAGDGSANDLADIAAGYVPRSLRADAVHLNDAGYAVVAATFRARTLAIGW